MCILGYVVSVMVLNVVGQCWNWCDNLERLTRNGFIGASFSILSVTGLGYIRQ